MDPKLWKKKSRKMWILFEIMSVLRKMNHPVIVPSTYLFNIIEIYKLQKLVQILNKQILIYLQLTW